MGPGTSAGGVARLHAPWPASTSAFPAAAPPPLQVFAAVVRHVDWDIVRCLVIAGPGFAKDQFREYLDKGGWYCWYWQFCGTLVRHDAATWYCHGPRRRRCTRRLAARPLPPLLQLAARLQRRSGASCAPSCSTSPRSCWPPPPRHTSTPSSEGSLRRRHRARRRAGRTGQDCQGRAGRAGQGSQGRRRQAGKGSQGRAGRHGGPGSHRCWLACGVQGGAG